MSNNCFGTVAHLDHVPIDVRSVTAITELFDAHFPFKGCSTRETINLARKSKFYKGLNDQRDSYTLLFESRYFRFQFSIEKRTGNSQYPFAIVRWKSV